MRRVLLDHCVPRPFRNLLIGCDVSTANDEGWAALNNGELLNAAESRAFEILITADKHLRYQQNLQTRKLAIIELPTNRLRQVVAYAPQVNESIAKIPPGAYEIIPAM